MINRLILGTARWGSTVDTSVAYEILDKFVDAGGRHVDTATNYPIDGDPQKYGLAIQILSEWLQMNSAIKLNVLVKMGSINNAGSPETNLSPAALLLQFNRIQFVLKESLDGVGIHWDNRDDTQKNKIQETTSLFEEFSNRGLRIGLSGIVGKEAYALAAPNLVSEWEIQVKESMNDSEVRNAYLKYFPGAKYLAYGISSEARSSSEVKKMPTLSRITNTEEVGKQEKYLATILTILNVKKVSKVIVGPRTLNQMESIASSFH
jgi:aryl-alcohol dehydrogenase-like predicted oxidoreductase